ncbi:MAG: hypothetical protein MR283_02445 [Erysipelotrichaceae bacterium]|nr:hypothetical protein [Erysipelotrichaceae bacterium]
MTSISPLSVSALPTTAPASDFKVNTAWTADANSTSNANESLAGFGFVIYKKRKEA